MFELFIGSDAVRRHVGDPLKADADEGRVAPKRDGRPRRRRPAVRASAAAALRSLAERLEPSPSR